MSTMQAEVFEAFRVIGVPEDKALQAASALARRDDDVLSLKSDVATVKADVATLKLDVATLKLDVATLKSDVATLKSDLKSVDGKVAKIGADGAVIKWMLGVLVTGNVAIILKLFIH